MADEALETALCYYRESRELCIDLAADRNCEGDDDERLRGFPGVSIETATILSPPGTEASRASAAATCGALLRAEFNVGMALVEREEHGDAVRHLSAVGERFWEIFQKLIPEKEPSGDRGAARRGPLTAAALSRPEAGGDAGTVRRNGSSMEGAGKVSWSTAVLDREGFSDLAGLYASSLFLLGECLALCSAPSSCSSPPALLADARHRGVLRSTPTCGATLSAPRAVTSGPQDAADAVAAVAEQPRARLDAAAETLEASTEAFLNIDDPAGAVGPLAKLLEILELIGDEGEGRERVVSRAETLCNRASTCLSSDQVSFDLETESLDRAREGIKRLRARWGQDAYHERDPEAGQGDRAPGEVTRGKELHHPSEGVNVPRQQQSQEKNEPGNFANASTPLRPGGDAAGGSTAEEVCVRVGPLPTAGFVQRRRRQRALSLAPALVGGRGCGKAFATGQTSGGSRLDATAASRRQRETPETHPGTRKGASGVSDVTASGLVARAGERLPQGVGGSFAAMRAVVAAAGGAAATSSSATTAVLAEETVVINGDRPCGDPRAVGEGREDGRTALLALYKHTVRRERDRWRRKYCALKVKGVRCTLSGRRLSVTTSRAFSFPPDFSFFTRPGTLHRDIAEWKRYGLLPSLTLAMLAPSSLFLNAGLRWRKGGRNQVPSRLDYL